MHNRGSEAQTTVRVYPRKAPLCSVLGIQPGVLTHELSSSLLPSFSLDVVVGGVSSFSASVVLLSALGSQPGFLNHELSSSLLPSFSLDVVVGGVSSFSASVVLLSALGSQPGFLNHELSSSLLPFSSFAASVVAVSVVVEAVVVVLCLDVLLCGSKSSLIFTSPQPLDSSIFRFSSASKRPGVSPK